MEPDDLVSSPGMGGIRDFFRQGPAPDCNRLPVKGIDLSALRGLPHEELVVHLKDLHVDVDIKNGEKIRIFCD